MTLYQDLPESRKQEERRKLRDSSWYPDEDWYTYVLDDAYRVAEILGIEIGSPNGHYKNIWFSGFGNQGDGASFAGGYRHKNDSVAKVTEYCGGQDLELIQIAERLTALQLQCLLQRGAFYKCSIESRDRYCHSGTMSTTDEYLDRPEGDFNFDDYFDYDLPGTKEFSDAVEREMRNFADWIYGQLENEYDHLLSDEVLDEQLHDTEIDEDLDEVEEDG